MERTGGHEEDMIGLHHAVLGLHVGTFNDRQQVTLHPFARHVGPHRFPSGAGDLVDLVEKDDAHLFHAVERIGDEVVPVDELVELLLGQDAARLGHLHVSLLGALGEHVFQHLAERLHSFGRALRRHDIEHRRCRLRDLDFDVTPFQLAVPEQLPQFVAGALVALLGGGGVGLLLHGAGG